MGFIRLQRHRCAGEGVPLDGSPVASLSESPRNSSSSLIAILLGFETFVCASAILLEAVDSILAIFGSTTYGWSQ